MHGSFENSSTSFLGLFGQFIACLGRSKARGSRSKADLSSQTKTEAHLEASEKYFAAPGRGCICKETISSRHHQTTNVQHTTYDTTGLFIGTEDTKRAARDPYTPIHDEGGSGICAPLQAMRVIKVISIRYEECTLKTATLCIELDLNGRRKPHWLEYQHLIGTPGEEELIPGAKDAIERFGPMWRY